MEGPHALLRSARGPRADNPLRVAIVHYWFVRRRGGERVVEALAELFPQADIYALVVGPGWREGAFSSHKVTPSFLQKIPFSSKFYRKLLPLFPYALEQFDLDDYDLVISSESGPAKGIVTRARTCHICYCHSPMRYLWDLYHPYRSGKGLGMFSRPVFSLTAHYLRMWDLASVSRVDYFVANSANVAARIRKHYRREATVIPPPVDLSPTYLTKDVGDHYLVVSPLVDYKRIDLAIAACNRLKRPLRIVGDGEEYRRLRRLAGPEVRFLGYLSDKDVRQQYAECRALLFPGEEDFGIVPVEAQSCGRPVIAFGRGGVLETVVCCHLKGQFNPESSTGILFHEQSVEAMVNAMQLFEEAERRFVPAFIHQHVECFGVRRFKSTMLQFVEEKLAEFTGRKSAASV